jgi:hypothetical protein
VRGYAFLIQSSAEFNQLSTRGKFRRVMNSLNASGSIRAQAIRPVVSMEGNRPFANSLASPHHAPRPASISCVGAIDEAQQYRASARETRKRNLRESLEYISYCNCAIRVTGTQDGDWSASVRFETDNFIALANSDAAYETEIYGSKSLAIADAQMWIDELEHLESI